MLVALLPVLTLATTETITFDSRDELERALTVRVRSAIETGWALVDVSPEDDGSGFGFTVTRDGDARRHVADFDGNVYRVGPAALPEHPTKPSDLLLQALREGGGIELSSGCGYDVQAYFIDGYAVGPQARELAARSLAAADDLEGAWISDRRATFQLETDEQAIDLIVTLTEDGGVAETELRRYESRADRTVYRRRDDARPPPRVHLEHPRGRRQPRPPHQPRPVRDRPWRHLVPLQARRRRVRGLRLLTAACGVLDPPEGPRGQLARSCAGSTCCSGVWICASMITGTRSELRTRQYCLASSSVRSTCSMSPAISMSIPRMIDVNISPSGVRSTVPRACADQRRISMSSRAANASNVVSMQSPSDDSTRCSGDHDDTSPSSWLEGPPCNDGRGGASTRARDANVRLIVALY
jgi:hypothetical protein